MRAIARTLSVCLVLLTVASLTAGDAQPATVAAPPVAGQTAERTIELQAPLSTLVRLLTPLTGHEPDLHATVTVPADAPGDLGVGVFVVDQHGRWFQRLRPGVLPPGTHHLEFSIAGDSGLLSTADRSVWTPATASVAARTGLFFWSASGSRAKLLVADLAVGPAADVDGSSAAALRDLTLENLQADGTPLVATGARWSLTVRPDPFPANPFDSDDFTLDLVVTTPSGETLRFPGFYDQPMDGRDRGDRESLRAQQAGRFVVRFRASQPGVHRLSLEATWKGGRHVTSVLPSLTVSGQPWDGFVRVDHDDPRFFSVSGKHFWPLGPNLRSLNDTRGQDRLHTVFTPDRGTLSYEAYLRRLAANGVTAVEIWMSSWNLALEWRGDWPGFYGQGRYNLENAWRLDRVLDTALALGIRVNLVINNHGQASTGNDPEWASNPYNRQRGGKLSEAWEFFTAPYALAGQERLRRYIVARYADHPAIIGWKLWSEVNLTAARGNSLRTWHEQAATRWKALDPYDHGVTTHWCGDYHLADRAIVALPSIDYVCIDAYHGNDQLLADLIWRSTLDPVPGRGLSQFNKPVLTTEFGCNWDAGPEPQMRAEHATGPWAALVSGHAGSPMLWWFEWLDQGGLFAPYQAVSHFLVGEDLRGSEARGIVLNATSPAGMLWCRAWSRPGRMLGYVLDHSWGRQGRDSPAHDAARVEIGSNIAAGALAIEWWDADQGAWHKRQDLAHPGGPLALTPPTFQRHIAFKLFRLPTGGATGG